MLHLDPYFIYQMQQILWDRWTLLHMTVSIPYKWCTPVYPPPVTSYGRAKAGQPARTYIQQLCADTGCSPEDLPEAMDDREGWRETVRDIRAVGMTRWWCLSHPLISFPQWMVHLQSYLIQNVWMSTECLMLTEKYVLVFCWFVFYGISTFVGYLTPNPFFWK